MNIVQLTIQFFPFIWIKYHDFVSWINRCWRVDWPYKDGFNRFKDANEVTFLLSIVIHKVFAPLKVASELYNRNE